MLLLQVKVRRHIMGGASRIIRQIRSKFSFCIEFSFPKKIFLKIFYFSAFLEYGMQWYVIFASLIILWWDLFQVTLKVEGMKLLRLQLLLQEVWEKDRKQLQSEWFLGNTCTFSLLVYFSVLSLHYFPISQVMPASILIGWIFHVTKRRLFRSFVKHKYCC